MHLLITCFHIIKHCKITVQKLHRTYTILLDSILSGNYTALRASADTWQYGGRREGDGGGGTGSLLDRIVSRDHDRVSTLSIIQVNINPQLIYS